MNTRITVSPEIVEKCEAFADLRMLASEQLYRLRGEDNVAKIRQDIITGAIGEFAVYKHLKSVGVDVEPPDLSIHHERQKSFAADLVAPNARFHIKSQTTVAAQKYGSSWLFQTADRLLTLPSEQEYLVFCIVEGSTVTIRAIVGNIDLVEAEITKKPKIPKYALTKCAIYLEDVLNCGIDINKF